MLFKNCIGLKDGTARRGGHFQKMSGPFTEMGVSKSKNERSLWRGPRCRREMLQRHIRI